DHAPAAARHRRRQADGGGHDDAGGLQRTGATARGRRGMTVHEPGSACALPNGPAASPMFDRRSIMTLRIAGIVAGLSVAILTSAPAWAAPTPEESKVVKPTDDEIKKAQGQIEAALKAINATFARIQPITDEPVLRMFPKQLFFSVLFPQYPVARVAPPGH